MAFDDMSTDALRAKCAETLKGSPEWRAFRAELGERDNARVVLENAILSGLGPALAKAGVPAATIEAATAAVEARKAARLAEKLDPARIAMIQRDAAGDTSGAVYVPPTGGV